MHHPSPAWKNERFMNPPDRTLDGDLHCRLLAFPVEARAWLESQPPQNTYHHHSSPTLAKDYLSRLGIPFAQTEREIRRNIETSLHYLYLASEHKTATPDAGNLRKSAAKRYRHHLRRDIRRMIEHLRELYLADRLAALAA